MSLALHAYQAIIVFRNCSQKVMRRNRQHTSSICLRWYEMHLLGWQLLSVACGWCEKSCLFTFSSFVIRSAQQANVVTLQYCYILTYCVDCVVYTHKYLSVTLHQKSRGSQVSSMDEIAYTFRIFISPWLCCLRAMHVDRQWKYFLCSVFLYIFSVQCKLSSINSIRGIMLITIKINFQFEFSNRGYDETLTMDMIGAKFWRIL